MLATDRLGAQPLTILGDCNVPPACATAATAGVCQSLANTNKAIANCSPPSAVGKCSQANLEVMQKNAARYLQELRAIISSCTAEPPQPRCTAVTATTFTSLYTFAGGADGQTPLAGLLRDKKGALYGTTFWGGTTNHGTVFRLTPPVGAQTQWNKAVLYSFGSGSDGDGPDSALTSDSGGALYGTTGTGGSATAMGPRVFELQPSGTTPWSETVIASFSNEGGNNYVWGPVIFGKGGALYGTTTGTTWAGTGGTDNGSVFELTFDPNTSQWKQTTIYTFAGGSDGFDPMYSLTADASGVLYGTTKNGGTGAGTVFKLTPSGANPPQWTKTTLYQFSSAYGAAAGPLTLDGSGALYGMRALGAEPTMGTPNAGVAFKLTPPGQGQTQWTETILHTFSGAGDGLAPGGALLLDKNGALYGTTWLGGAGSGIVFRLTPPTTLQGQWTETVLHSFTGGVDGGNPVGSLIADPCGALYGTANSGGVGNGTVFTLAFP